jgi:DNA-binding NarL/FixJ family response regulator
MLIAVNRFRKSVARMRACLAGSRLCASDEPDWLPSRANTQFAGIPLDADWIVRSIPDRRKVGASKRDALLEPRPQKLDAAREEQMRTLASRGRTLREIGAELGVSHETVRISLRQSYAVALVADERSRWNLTTPHARQRFATGTGAGRRRVDRWRS